MARRDRSGNGDPSPWVRPGFIAAALVIVVAVACGLYALTTTGGHRNAAAPARTTAPSTVTTNRTREIVKAKTAAKGTGGCDVPPGPQTVPTTAPSNVTWTLWRTAALPSSPTAGPMVVQGDLARCYAHSPLGALIAAAQINSRYELAMTTKEWQSIVYSQMVPSSGRNKLVAETAAAQKADPAAFGAPTPPGLFPQIAGFLFISYSSQEAVIDIVVTKSDQYGVASEALSWAGADWKLDVQPDGATTGPVSVVSSTVGYVAWSGV